jgi:hypothetical protein
MYRLAAQAQHRNRETSTFASACFPIANFTEVVFKPKVYGISGRRVPYLFLSCGAKFGFDQLDRPSHHLSFGLAGSKPQILKRLFELCLQLAVAPGGRLEN